MAKLLDGKALARTMQAELAEQVAQFTAGGGPVPCLAAILAGDNPASEVYVRGKRLACECAGMTSRLHRLPADASQTDLMQLVEQLNHDPAVHGILVQLPLPQQIDEQLVLRTVNPAKDVDAFHPENVGLIVQGQPRFLPCTPHGVQQLLVRNGIEIPGKHVVVVGRSDIVGKPMAIILMQRGPQADATVTICHSRTQSLPDVTRSADILIVAIGRANFVTAEMVKPGAVVVDVGMNRLAERLVGDVDFAAVEKVASHITPVPGGVGPMTITMLLHNTLAAARQQAV